MIALLLAAVLMAQEPTGLGPEARALIAPVAEAIAAEEARQAALPPPTDVRERLERMGRLDQVGRQAATKVDLSVLLAEERQAASAAMWAPVSAMDERLLVGTVTAGSGGRLVHRGKVRRAGVWRGLSDHPAFERGAVAALRAHP